MTVDIPVWLLWTAYVVGGVVGFVLIAVVIFLAFVGYAAVTTWVPPRW